MTVDFKRLKELVSIVDVAHLFGLVLKGRGVQLRGECPTCKTAGPRALAVNTEKASWYCFGARQGGDLISLAAHLTGKGQRESAEEIALKLNVDTSSDSSPIPNPKNPDVANLTDLRERLLKKADDTNPDYLEAALLCDELIDKLTAL